MPYPSSVEVLRKANQRRTARRMGVVPAGAVLATTNLISSLTNSLGPSHTSANVASNQYKFDDLGQFAVQNPYGNYQAITGLNPNVRTPTSKTALAWLSQIVNGPGFQGGAGTPFPDNPRDFLVWNPSSDPVRVQERTYAAQVLQRVQQVLAGGAAGPSSGTIPGTNVPWSVLPDSVASALNPLTGGVTAGSGTILAVPPAGTSVTTPRPVQAGPNLTTMLLIGGLAVGALVLTGKKRR